MIFFVIKMRVYTTHVGLVEVVIEIEIMFPW